MPRSWTPVVSFQLAFAFPGLLPSVSRRTSAFPACAGLSFRTTIIIFSEFGHAACTLATPGFIHTLMDMHAGSLQFQWLTFSGGNSAVTCLHPLGSNIQFHNLHFDPTDLNLTRHDRDRFWDIPVPKIDSPTRQPLVPRPPCVRAASPHHRFARRWLRSTPTNGSTVCRMRSAYCLRRLRDLSIPSPLRQYARAYTFRGLRAFASLSSATRGRTRIYQGYRSGVLPPVPYRAVRWG